MNQELGRPEKILTFVEAVDKMIWLRSEGQKIVLAQGAFDILHIGHIHYLRLAKEGSDVLFAATERDETLRVNKGEGRPFNSTQDRLNFLSELVAVDYAFAYDEIVNYDTANEVFSKRLRFLSPNFLAVSSWDPNLDNKRMLAHECGIEILEIEDLWVSSTSRLLQLAGFE